jgi:hypothetical protein
MLAFAKSEKDEVQTIKSQNPHPVAQKATRMGHPLELEIKAIGWLRVSTNEGVLRSMAGCQGGRANTARLVRCVA